MLTKNATTLLVEIAVASNLAPPTMAAEEDCHGENSNGDFPQKTACWQGQMAAAPTQQDGSVILLSGGG